MCCVHVAVIQFQIIICSYQGGKLYIMQLTKLLLKLHCIDCNNSQQVFKYLNNKYNHYCIFGTNYHDCAFVLLITICHSGSVLCITAVTFYSIVYVLFYIHNIMFSTSVCVSVYNTNNISVLHA